MASVIYRIRSKNENITDIYIGSTTQFNKRKVLHKSRCNNEHGFMYSSNPYVFIRSNGGWDEWVMEILETYHTTSKDDLRHRERLYYEVYEPSLNMRAPYVTPSQFNARRYTLNRDRSIEYRKKYYDANRELLIQKAKDYASSRKTEKSAYNKQYAALNKERLDIYRRDRARSKRETILMSLEDIRH